MTGLFLIIFGLLSLFLIIMAIKEKSEEVTFLSILGSIPFIILLIALPISINESKAKVIKLENYIELSKKTDKTVTFDYIDVEYNQQTTEWKEKGQKWYYHKWYYHKSTKNAKLIY